MRKLSATTAKTTIGMMRSIASHKPITPFHLMAADQMEQLLNEVVAYRATIDAKNLASDPAGLKPSSGWRKKQVALQEVSRIGLEIEEGYRNEILEEVAKEFDKMTALGDTAASFAVYVRNMKNENYYSR